MADAALDELDCLLITALQHAPRAHWREVGAMVGADATTVSRRWARLTGEGLAWLCCHPAPAAVGDVVVAFIEVNCVHGRLHEVCAQLVDDAPLFDIEYMTGARDLLLTAVLRSPAQLARYVAFRLESLEGVTAVRTQVLTALHIEGSRWRMDRLHGVTKSSAPLLAAGSQVCELSEADRELIRLLDRDVRQSAERLARDSGLSPTTVRRRLARLDAARAITYRCEVARSASGWPVSATLWVTVPAKDVQRVVAQLAVMRETRMCVSLSGPGNLMATVRLRTVGDLRAFESSLTQRVPQLVVNERSLTLWRLKHSGRVLDSDGRVLRSVAAADEWQSSDTRLLEKKLLERLRAPGRTTGQPGGASAHSATVVSEG